MKSLVLGFVSLIFFSAFRHLSESAIPALTCSLTTEKNSYKLGELPKLRVVIDNNTGKDIYLVGKLDGSDVKWRMPYCYFTIEKPKPDSVPFSRCGNIDPLRKEDFVLIKAGEKFNPYGNIDHHGFVFDHNILNPETFRNAGIYKIRFHYSTNSSDLSKFKGQRSFDPNKPDSLQLSPLFNRMPKMDLVSNTIEIKFHE